jgi:hypothetical protein
MRIKQLHEATLPIHSLDRILETLKRIGIRHEFTLSPCTFGPFRVNQLVLIDGGTALYFFNGDFVGQGQHNKKNVFSAPSLNKNYSTSL